MIGIDGSSASNVATAGAMGVGRRLCRVGWITAGVTLPVYLGAAAVFGPLGHALGWTDEVSGEVTVVGLAVLAWSAIVGVALAVGVSRGVVVWALGCPPALAGALASATLLAGVGAGSWIGGPGTTGMAEIIPFAVVDTVVMAAAFVLAAVASEGRLALPLRVGLPLAVVAAVATATILV